jgi:hypothetical protein
MNKLHELHALSSAALDFIAISESWLHGGIPDSIISAYLPNYLIYRSDRVDRRAGGVVLLANNVLHVEHVTSINVTNVESIWCKLVTCNDQSACPVLVACVYRSPSCSYDDLNS